MSLAAIASVLIEEIAPPPTAPEGETAVDEGVFEQALEEEMGREGEGLPGEAEDAAPESLPAPLPEIELEIDGEGVPALAGAVVAAARVEARQETSPPAPEPGEAPVSAPRLAVPAVPAAPGEAGVPRPDAPPLAGEVAAEAEAPQQAPAPRPEAERARPAEQARVAPPPPADDSSRPALRSDVPADLPRTETPASGPRAALPGAPLAADAEPRRPEAADPTPPAPRVAESAPPPAREIAPPRRSEPSPEVHRPVPAPRLDVEAPAPLPGPAAPIEVAATSTTPAQAARPTPADALPVHVEWLAQRGGGSARIDLHPPHLGRVEIAVRVRGAEVEVSIAAPEAAAQVVVNAQRDSLADALGARDLKLTHFEVGGGAREQAGSDTPGGRPEPGFERGEEGPPRQRALASRPEPHPDARASGRSGRSERIDLHA